MTRIQSLEPFKEFFTPKIPDVPQNRYVSILLFRETKSYAIFTTEPERLDLERTQAKLNSDDNDTIDRIVLFKRKQVAPERRTGKALLRQYVEGYNCHLMDNLCTQCPDCLIYGFAAVEREGSRRSRVFTDSCFTIRPYHAIQRHMMFNAINEKDQTSLTITEYDYVLPEVFLPAVVTTVDLTVDEFIYVLSNILRTSRYGKEVSRQGYVRNHVVGLAFSDAELFSNLEFSQILYELLHFKGKNLEEEPFSLGELKEVLPDALDHLLGKFSGRLMLVLPKNVQVKSLARKVAQTHLESILDEIVTLNQDEKRFGDFLRELNKAAHSFSKEGKKES